MGRDPARKLPGGGVGPPVLVAGGVLGRHTHPRPPAADRVRQQPKGLQIQVREDTIFGR